MHCNVGLISGLYLIRYVLGLAALLAFAGFKGYFTVEFHKALKLQPRNFHPSFNENVSLYSDLN